MERLLQFLDPEFRRVLDQHPEQELARPDGNLKTEMDYLPPPPAQAGVPAILDYNQFGQLLELEEPDIPIVAEILEEFVKQGDQIMNQILMQIQNPETSSSPTIRAHIHQLKGSALNIGAQEMVAALEAMRSSCSDSTEEVNWQQLGGSFQWLQHSYQVLQYHLARFSAVRNKRKELGHSPFIPSFG
mmetsp:Transcript_28229/g.34247  ORF Transcript_28229/g.34247 Transcript_28229/m.34247 type:complete len:187 (-) Transcript_28229:1169-1729(-)